MLFIQLLTRLSVSAQQHTLEARAAGLSPFACCRDIFWISRLYAFLFLSNMTLQICSPLCTGRRRLTDPGPHKEICMRIRTCEDVSSRSKTNQQTWGLRWSLGSMWEQLITKNKHQDPHCLWFTVLFSLFASLPAELLSWASCFFTFPSLVTPLPHLSAPHTLVTLVQFVQKPASMKKSPMELEENILLINSKCDLAIKVTFTLLNTPH